MTGSSAEVVVAARRRLTGQSVLGMAAVQSQFPLDRSENLKKSRRPLVTRSGPIFVAFWDGCVERMMPAKAVADTS